MTGFGSASHSRAGLQVTVETRSVNNRFLKISLRCPAMLFSREQEIEAIAREKVSRGTVSISIRIGLESRPVRVRLNAPVVEEYKKLFTKLKRAGGVEGEPTLSLLAALPGVFDAEEVQFALPEEGWEAVRKTVVLALDRLVRMRKREGKNLKRDLSRRRTRIAGLVRKISTRAPRVAEEYFERMENRINRLVSERGIEVEERDLVRELGIFTERSDVTEELTRISSHMDQYAQILGSDGEKGRRLDFLAQEMLREANTIGAKSGDVEVSRLCVDLKVEFDRLREQVQNVE